ncbi:dimethyl sulfoxide reductase anchor subunit family protein [Thiobacter aerophilum]|uniref:DmsC/YnfH family molybdoenzyme membrane anchor subunit n=1 Tax=Thiobacter aerophilum TaxID=3121275 RepID=A0ABV0EF78_9BURK
MHPAFSVIFFTVASGAGFGLFALLYLADLLQLGGGLSRQQVSVGGAIALVLIIAGLLSSVGHLANPKNAWRAFSRWRTSWLSREGVFAVTFFPFAFGYVGLSFLDLGLEGLLLTLGALATLLAWVTVFSTSMIYACLKTIRQWNTPLVPANYLALGHYTGALILMLIANQGEVDRAPYYFLVLAFLVAAAFLKGLYYFWIGSPVAASTIHTATGFTRAQVKLFDAGHTHGTFLTQEFGFQIARRWALALRIFVFLAGFVIPFVWLVQAGPEVSGGAVVALIALLGVLAERWLFFAEARHVVNLYHGAQRC